MATPGRLKPMRSGASAGRPRRVHLWSIGLLVNALLSAGAGAQALPAPRTPLGADALRAIIAHLARSHPTERLQFAAIAFEQLAETYRVETGSGATARDGDPANAGRWQRAAWAEITRLEQLAGQLPATADAVILLEAGLVMRIVVGTESVLLDAPRVSDPHTLPARVIERYCAIATCPATTPPRHHRPRAWAGWSFGNREPPVLDTSSGLRFRFSDTAELRARQEAALELVTAFEQAADDLGWYVARGLIIDWTAFHLAPLPDSDRAVLVLDRAGTYLPLALGWRDIPQDALRRWFRAKLSGGNLEVVIDSAETILETGSTTSPR